MILEILDTLPMLYDKAITNTRLFILSEMVILL